MSGACCISTEKEERGEKEKKIAVQSQLIFHLV
jgi:hypothetical protein